MGRRVAPEEQKGQEILGAHPLEEPREFFAVLLCEQVCAVVGGRAWGQPYGHPAALSFGIPLDVYGHHDSHVSNARARRVLLGGFLTRTLECGCESIELGDDAAAKRDRFESRGARDSADAFRDEGE